MNNDKINQPKLAVLIDADNTPARIVNGLLAEIAKFGIASVKRIYGDWTNPHLKGWKESLLEYSIIPIQQFGYTVGKNATDTAMIIDAMDLLYTEKFDGFCIVSSDSDFTSLAARIREEGLTVYGFGEVKTPRPFVAACDKFIYTEILREDESSEQPQTRKSTAILKQDTKLVSLLRNAVEDSTDDTGWAYLGNVGQNIAKRDPAFDSRNYGQKKLGELLDATDLFIKEERVLNNSPGKLLYYMDKRKKR